MKKKIIGTAWGASLLVFSSGALAQTTAAQAPAGRAEPDAEATSEQDIVVTGTLLRGAAPVGARVIGLGEGSVATTGATTSNELLGTIPQVSNYFNKVPSADLSVAANQLQISRPNLRNISSNSGSSSATLVLVDGHRIASVGVSQASVDPDLIPAAAIERVEVVTEGGSATYGADAVGGVINFITRRRFDGVKVDARYGFADDYWTVDAIAIAGKDWGSGSAYLSYSFTKNDALFGRDRDFVKGLDYSTTPALPRGRACDTPNVSTFIVFAGMQIPRGNIPNPPNTCDPTDDQTIVPAAERHGVLAGLSQHLSDTLSLDVRAFYSQRETHAVAPATGTVVTSTANRAFNGIARTGSESVQFSFAPALGRESAPSDTKIQEWGVNTELKKELGSNWQVRGLLNYSRSNSLFSLVGPNTTRLNAAGQAATAATAINPYNIVATNPALLADILDNEIAGQAKDDLFDVRAIFDGTLLTLPGGGVRLAVGYEYMHDGYQQRYQSEIRRGALAGVPYSAYSRDVQSLFGELQVPIFGADNAMGGIQSFVVSASGRYDHYSDFGDTFNPKFGATYKPFRWLAIRGNWGTSFTAPTPLDQLGSQRNTINMFPFVAFVRPGDTIGFTAGSTVAVQGSRPNLQPQTADTWSVGFDADPAFIPGLHGSLSYYKVHFKDLLSTPSPSVSIFTNFPDVIQTSLNGLSPAVLRTFASLAPNGSAIIEPLIANNTRVYEAVDFRVGNFGTLKTSGLDFALNYRRPTGFGGIDASVSGNYQLTRESQVNVSSPTVDLLDVDTSRLALQASLGIDIGGLRAQATLYHRSGFDVARSASRPQDHVGSFDTVDLFFKYDVDGKDLFKNLSFSLNVRNVFDQDPPVSLQTGSNGDVNGYANGFTLGRLFMLGVSKKF